MQSQHTAGQERAGMLLHACVPHRCLTPSSGSQASHSLHADTEQSTMHSCDEHVLLSSRIGHGRPPSPAGFSTLRDRAVVPPPQVTVQSVHSDHSSTLQSFSPQVTVLHACSSTSPGHCAPPVEGIFSTTR